MRSVGGRISFGGRWGGDWYKCGMYIYIYMYMNERVGGGFFARIWLCLTNPARIRERGL